LRRITWQKKEKKQQEKQVKDRLEEQKENLLANLAENNSIFSPLKYKGFFLFLLRNYKDLTNKN